MPEGDTTGTPSGREVMTPEVKAQIEEGRRQAQAEAERWRRMSRRERAQVIRESEAEAQRAQADLDAMLAANPELARSVEENRRRGEAEFQRILAEEQGKARRRVQAAMPSFESLVQQQMGYVRGLINSRLR